METKPYVVFILALILLIVVALWQFYSLAWGGGLKSSHTASPHRPPIALGLAIAPD